MSSYTGIPDHEAWQRIQATISSLEFPENRDVIRSYLNKRRVDGWKMSTLASDMNLMRLFAEHVGDLTFAEVDQRLLSDFLTTATSRRHWRNADKSGQVTVTKRVVPLKPSTMHQRKVRLKAFYCWLLGTDDPPLFKGMRMAKPADHDLPTDSILTREDLIKLIQSQRSPRTRAVLAVLHETGFRAGELCALNISSYQLDEYGGVLVLPKGAPGLKTGSRRVRIIDSLPYLRIWIEEHPLKEDSHAPLFTTVSHRAMNARMTPNALYRFTERAARDAGIEKKCNPHLFRHSAATFKAKEGANEAELRAFFGWTKKSNMPSYYTHLAGKDYDEMLLKRRGIMPEGHQSKRPLEPRRCKDCGHQNLPTNRLCTECGYPVSPLAEAEMLKLRDDRFKEALAEEVARIVPSLVPPALRKNLVQEGGSKASEEGMAESI